MGERRKSQVRVAFLHPDLGLGGAERLVVDAAVELASRGHQVDVYTAFHDRNRCFEETVEGPFSVTVAGGWFPRSIFGLAHAFCAYVRCILVALHIAWVAARRKRRYEVVFVDQVSAAIPFLHWLTSSRVLFYCHHPDLLLAQRRPGLHQLYRLPLDWLEQVTTGQADRIVVNSAYTAEVFETTFRRLHSRGMKPGVLHPACHVPSNAELHDSQQSKASTLPGPLLSFLGEATMFLSINRFERKKDVGLAVRAFAELGSKSSQPPCRLVVAGGYDPRLAENRDYLEELRQLAAELGVQDKVWFLPSFSDAQRAALLAACTALLYTPINEHFGIVPLEAMAAARPVIACNSGGPRESVIHNATGFLCEPTPASFAAAMRQLQGSKELQKKLGAAARAHVSSNFSRSAFGGKLEAIVLDLAALH